MTGRHHHADLHLRQVFPLPCCGPRRPPCSLADRPASRQQPHRPQRAQPVHRAGANRSLAFRRCSRRAAIAPAIRRFAEGERLRYPGSSGASRQQHRHGAPTRASKARFGAPRAVPSRRTAPCHDRAQVDQSFELAHERSSTLTRRMQPCDPAHRRRVHDLANRRRERCRTSRSQRTAALASTSRPLQSNGRTSRRSRPSQALAHRSARHGPPRLELIGPVPTSRGHNR